MEQGTQCVKDTGGRRGLRACEWLSLGVLRVVWRRKAEDKGPCERLDVRWPVCTVICAGHRPVSQRSHMNFPSLLPVLLKRSHTGFVVRGEAAGGDVLSGGEGWSEPSLISGGVTCEPLDKPGAHSPASPHDGELCRPLHTASPCRAGSQSRPLLHPVLAALPHTVPGQGMCPEN